MNQSREESIGFIYMNNCSLPATGVSMINYSDWQIGIAFILGCVLTIVFISVVVLLRRRYARRLHRTNTIRSNLHQLTSFELQC